MPNVTANAQIATATGSAGTIPATTATSTSFPAQNLGIRVDLNLNGTWTDITKYVLQRNSVQITGMGRADWTSTIQAAQLTLTVRNTDGRFTPKNSAGAYFPNITRNTPIRLFVSSSSVTGVSYAGFRFYGEVSEWPPHWDPSQRDVAVDIVASGIWRRLSQQQTTIGSAFRRYFQNLTGVNIPQAYWPMEDGTNSTGFVAATASTGNATWSGGPPSLAASTSFPGSDAIPAFNSAAITASVPAGGTPTNNVTRFVLSVPAAGDSASGTTNWNLIEIDSSGTVAKFEVYLNFNGTLLIQGRNSGGTVVFSGTTTTVVKALPVLVSCELTPSGSNINWALRIIQPGAAGILESVTGTLTAASVGGVSTVKLSRANALFDSAVGHLSVSYGAPTSMVSAAYALNGYLGEFALDRFTRLCGEFGIASETIGTSSSSAPMGPQIDDTLTSLLQSIEDTDLGLLYESRGQFGLGYRTCTSLKSQVPAAILPYASAVLDASLAPAYDDQFTRNSVTVTDQNGYAQQAILTAGAMSVLAPPNGIGNGYNYTRAVCVASDSQVAGIAQALLGVGAVDEVRFPVITLKQIRPANAALFTAVPSLRVGDYFQITSPPAFLTNSTIKQLVWGYSEVLNAKEWTFSFNATPESPYEPGYSPGTVQTTQQLGSPVTAGAAADASVTAATILNGLLASPSLTQLIAVSPAGIKVTISASAPVSPNTNDLWINSVTGQISQWNGSTWVAITFDASVNLQAGTIVASLIAASAVTAGTIAAGAIDGLVINGVTINGNTITAADLIIDTGSNNAVLAYSNPPVVSQTFTTSGTWKAPAGVTTVQVECWGGGAGGSANTTSGGGRSGGGGGEYAADSSVAVTAGNNYSYTVGGGGAAGTAGGAGSAGGNSTFAGNSVTVTAHGGTNVANSGPGGTGSTNATHFNGGNGSGQDGLGDGGGGGGSAGPSSAGNNAPGMAGASAVAGGGPGGQGAGAANAVAGGVPGGGGGGINGGTHNPAAGARGQVRITYQAAGTPVLSAAMAATAGTDAFTNAYAAGYTGPVTAIQPGSSPTAAETVHNMPGLSNSWALGTGGYAKYMLTADGFLAFSFQLNTPGTKTDGITLWAAGSLPSAYRPANPKRWPVSTGTAANSANNTPSITFGTDGSITATGINTAGTLSHLDAHGVMPLF